jgi:hypothetical protein
MLKILTTAGNEIEVDLLLARLQEAGIHCMRSAGGARGVLFGGRDILVDEEDLDRAREVLKANQGGFDEDELARLSDEAGRAATEEPSFSQPAHADDQSEPRTLGDIPVPAKEHSLRRALERLARGERGADTPDNPFGR